jgi:hypothetical protein
MVGEYIIEPLRSMCTLGRATEHDGKPPPVCPSFFVLCLHLRSDSNFQKRQRAKLGRLFLRIPQLCCARRYAWSLTVQEKMKRTQHMIVTLLVMFSLNRQAQGLILVLWFHITRVGVVRALMAVTGSLVLCAEK